MNIIAQVIGLLAVAAFLLSYQQKKRSGIILLNVCSRFLYILQYLMLGAFSGALLDILAAGASVIAERKQKSFIKKYIVAVIILINIIIIAAGGVVAYLNKSLIDIFSILGVLFEINALWFSNEKNIRLVSLFGAPFWFTYNILSQAYGSAIGNVLTIISIIIALIRYKNVKKNNIK